MIAPHFIGKDARDIESLIDAVHVADYKDVGLPFWCRVACCERSALLGGVIRKGIPVYLSGSGGN